MAKYKFYKVVFKSVDVIKEKVIIDKSPQAIKKKLIDCELVKIDSIQLTSCYREFYKKEILDFLKDSKLKKYKGILYSHTDDRIQLVTILACNLRSIDSMLRLSDWTEFFTIEKKECTYDEACFFFFENNKKTVITEF